MGFSIGGSSGFHSSSNINNNLPPKLAKHLQNPEFSSIISNLGIKPKDIINLIEHKGLQGELSFKDAQVIQLSADKAEALKALGLVGADLALVLESEDEIKRIKKRLKEIQSSTLNKAELAFLLNTLGLEFDEESLVFTDSRGGLVIIRSAIRALEESLENDDD